MHISGHYFTSQIFFLTSNYFILQIISTFIIFFYTAVCEIECKNGGHCIAPNKCQCRYGYVGKYCENGKFFH